MSMFTIPHTRRRGDTLRVSPAYTALYIIRCAENENALCAQTACEEALCEEAVIPPPREAFARHFCLATTLRDVELNAFICSFSNKDTFRFRRQRYYIYFNCANFLRSFLEKTVFFSQNRRILHTIRPKIEYKRPKNRMSVLQTPNRDNIHPVLPTIGIFPARKNHQ